MLSQLIQNRLSPVSGEDALAKVIPSFDLLKIGDVESLHFQFSYARGGSQAVDLAIRFLYPGDGAMYSILLTCGDVRKATLPEIGSDCFQLAELFIYDLGAQKDRRARYLVQDHVDGMVCYCDGLSFDEIARIDSNGQREVVWRSREGRIRPS